MDGWAGLHRRHRRQPLRRCVCAVPCSFLGVISILYVLLDRLVAIQRSGEVYERMSVRVQVGCSVAQLSKQESKEMIRTRSDVAKKESGRVWYYVHMHKSDDATGIGRDGCCSCGWAGVVLQAWGGIIVAQAACLFPGTVQAS